MSLRPCLAPLALAASLLFAGCYQVPVTGRRAMNIVDGKEVTAMSIAMFDQMKTQYKISRDKNYNDQLRRVGERISKVVFWDMPDADWEFVVFDNQEINAFAMAGGKVGVFTGLFRIAKTDDELASVISHEIAHVTAQHIHEKLSQEMAVNTVGTVGMVGAGLSGMPMTDMLGVAYGITTGIGGAAFDRKKEKEADEIGLVYMARAGYDPQAAIVVLDRLDLESAGNDPMQADLMSTHPSNPERIAALRAAMPRALEEKNRAGAVGPAIKVLK